MSYKPQPKSAYGDTDYSEDTWSPQSGVTSGGGGFNQSASPTSPMNYATPSPPAQYPGTIPRAASGMAQMPYSQGAGAMNPQYNQPMQQGQFGGQQPASTNPIAALAATITQEDILFMRSWQRDSLFNRVIPCEIAALGGYFMYNKTKGLPHTISRYLGLATVAFIFGKWSYRNEFKKRLAESPINTPYMQTLRKNLGVTSAVSSEFSSDQAVYGSTNNDYDQWNNSGSGGISGATFQPAPTYTADDRQFESPRTDGLSSSNYDQPYPGSDRLDNQTNNDERAKPRVSYDELRARNRGFMK